MLPRSMFGNVFHLTHFIGLYAVNSELVTTLAVQILTQSRATAAEQLPSD